LDPGQHILKECGSAGDDLDPGALGASSGAPPQKSEALAHTKGDNLPHVQAGLFFKPRINE
jgi:hypothetical protein